MVKERGFQFEVLEFVRMINEESEVIGVQVKVIEAFGSYTEAEKFINQVENSMENSMFKIERVYL